MQFTETSSSVTPNVLTNGDYAERILTSTENTFWKEYTADKQASLGPELHDMIWEWASSNAPMPTVIKIVETNTSKAFNLILSINDEGFVKGTVSRVAWAFLPTNNNHSQSNAINSSEISCRPQFS